MGIAPEITKSEKGLRESFRPIMRALTSAFAEADANSSAPTRADTQFQASQINAEFLLDADNRFDAFVGQELVFGNAVTDKLRILSGNAAGVARAIDAQSVSKRKQQDEDAHFRRILELLKSGQLGSQVANEIVDGWSDDEIAQIVAEIEAATGDSFENYAKKVLGEQNVPVRVASESDADYQRRLVDATILEILDPHTGLIKPEYVDDPMAKVIAREGAYQSHELKIAEIHQRAVREGASPELIEMTRAIASTGYAAAQQTAEGVGKSELVATARDGEDGHRDIALDSANNDDALGDILGGSEVLDGASREMNTAFDEAIAPPDQPNTITNEPGQGIDLTLKG